jgi:hypothetical protein
MDRLIQQVDKLSDKMDENHSTVLAQLVEIHKTQAMHTAQLEEHMRRTEIAEEAIEVMKSELRPVKAHAMGMRRAMKDTRKVWSWVWKIVAAVATAIILKRIGHG